MILHNFPFLCSFLIDIERHNLLNCVFSVSAYVASKELRYKTKHQLTVSERRCNLYVFVVYIGMIEARSSMIQQETSRNCIPIHADIRTFDWRVCDMND